MADTADLRRVVARLRARGFEVIEVTGWEHRGKGRVTTQGRIEHHTAGAPNGDAPSLRVVTFGRAGLRNSLSRWYVSRSGIIYLVALGVSWHAGRGVKGTNDTLSGTEAEHSGSIYEPWTKASLDAQTAISQEECDEFGLPPSRVFDHKEHAPRRKVDRTGIDPRAWRLRLATQQSETEDIMASLDDLRSVLTATLRPLVERIDWQHGRLNEATRLAQESVRAEIARIRFDVGLPEDPISDQVHVERVRNGKYDLAEVRRRLTDAAADGSKEVR